METYPFYPAPISPAVDSALINLVVGMVFAVVMELPRINQLWAKLTPRAKLTARAIVGAVAAVLLADLDASVADIILQLGAGLFAFAGGAEVTYKANYKAWQRKAPKDASVFSDTWQVS